MEVLKVSTKSNPNSVAGALAAIIKEKNIVEIQAVGAGAINQAVKAIAIARGFVAPSVCASIYWYWNRRRRKNSYKTYSTA